MSTKEVATWDTLKAHLILSVAFLFVAACLLLAIRASQQLAGLLLILVFMLFGASQGIQLTAEDIYTNNAVNKDLLQWTFKSR